MYVCMYSSKITQILRETDFFKFQIREMRGLPVFS